MASKKSSKPVKKVKARAVAAKKSSKKAPPSKSRRAPKGSTKARRAPQGTSGQRSGGTSPRRAFQHDHDIWHDQVDQP
jgi:hypothetical protein